MLRNFLETMRAIHKLCRDLTCVPSFDYSQQAALSDSVLAIMRHTINMKSYYASFGVSIGKIACTYRTGSGVDSMNDTERSETP
jgi:hypothetical protein